ncbi:MAG: DUF402 domain-containing protein [Myxococcales bacterium]|nr:MAG: DUF402 domain-containing protein [Myxococcales bacterium]
MSRTVRFRSLKWPERPHWEYDARWLGADAHGQWLGLETGAWLSRPGAGFHAHCEQVVLMPHDAWWCATFYGPDERRPVDIYVDIATPAEWDGDEVRCVDLDLDVIQGVTGRVWVDDEDEFARHRVEYSYPEDIVAGALAGLDEVHHLIEHQQAPFDRATSLGWLAKLMA